MRGGELVNSHSFPRDMESSLASFFIIFEQLRNGQYGRVKRGSLEKNIGNSFASKNQNCKYFQKYFCTLMTLDVNTTLALESVDTPLKRQ